MTPSNSIPKTYKQYHYTNYGAPEQVWKLVDVETKPLQPTQVRIKVAYTSINPIDYKLSEYGAYWFPRTPSEEAPFVIGLDVAGTIAEVGSDVTEFTVGDAVYAMTPIEAFGGAAEYVSIDAKYVAPKPKNIDFKSAAGVPLACVTSYQALITIGKVVSGDRVLVLGGSTSCGMFGIQLAKAVGAYVIATSSTRNFELVKSLGADQVIDYTKEKWFDVLDKHSVGVILDCGFDTQTWNNEAQKTLAKDTGRFVTLTQRVLQDPVESPIGATLLDVFCVASSADLREITALIEKGQMKVVVDSVYPLEKLVDAASKSKAGRLSGKVIVAVAEE
ncbi:Reticulon-4-interacting protein 1, partial [Globisporangium splendens]